MRGLFNRFRARALTISFILAISQAAHAAPKTRVLILTDPTDNSLQRLFLENALIEYCSNSSSIELITADVLPPSFFSAKKLIAEAEKQTDAARRQFDRLSLYGSLKLYQRALIKLERAAALSGETRALTDTLAMLAANHFLLRKKNKARLQLERLASLAPDYAPGQGVFNPEISNGFDLVAKKLASSPAARVTITSEPSGAAIFVDGRFTGLTPLTVTGLHRGAHYIRARRAHYMSDARVAKILPKKREFYLAFKLVPTPWPAGALSSIATAVLSSDTDQPYQELTKLMKTYQAEQIITVRYRDGLTTLVRHQQSLTRPYQKQASGSIDTIEDAKNTITALEPLHKIDATKDESSATIAANRPDDTVAPPPIPKLTATTSQPKATKSLPLNDAKEATKNNQSSPNDPVSKIDSTRSINRWKVPKIALVLYGGTLGFLTTGGIFGLQAWRNRTKYHNFSTTPSGLIDHANTTDQIEAASIKKAAQKKAIYADLFYGMAGLSLASAIWLHLAKPYQSDDTAENENKVHLTLDGIAIAF